MPAELIAQLEMLGEAIDELAPPVTIADLRVIGLRSVDPGVADHAVDAEVAPVVPLRPRARRIWLAAAAILVVAAFGVAAMLVRQTSSTSSGESPVTLPAQATIGLFPSGGRDGAIAAGYRSPTDVVSAYLAAITSPAALPDGYSVTATLETDAAATSIDADHASVAVSVQTTDDSGDARVFVQRVSTKPDAWQVTSAVVVPGELRGVTLADGRLSGAITTVAGGSTTLSAYDLATGAVLDTVTVTSPEQAGSVPPTPTPFELGVGGHTEVGLRYWNTVAPAGAYRFANFADQAISAGPTPTIGDVTTVLESPSATTTETDQTQNGAITPAAPATHLSADLQVGSSGPDVQAVQQRLADLGFDPGPIDGTYGATTKQAIWAFQSLILDVSRDQLTTTLTDEMWQRLKAPVTVEPRRPTGPGTTHVEIDVPRQVLAVFTDDRPVLVTHISTGQQNADGSPAHRCDTTTYDTDASGNPLSEPVRAQFCADSKTPGGVFTINRMVQGNQISPLGGMFNPVYFNYGIAIHGATNVPTVPASHGNVRIDMNLAAELPNLVHIGDQVYVWAQDGREPEDYSRAESLPAFPQPAPPTTGP